MKNLGYFELKEKSELLKAQNVSTTSQYVLNFNQKLSQIKSLILIKG